MHEGSSVCPIHVEGEVLLGLNLVKYTPEYFISTRDVVFPKYSIFMLRQEQSISPKTEEERTGDGYDVTYAE